MTTRTNNHTLPKTLNEAEFQAIADRCFTAASKNLKKHGRVAPVILIGRMHEGKVQIGAALPAAMETALDKDAATALMAAIVQAPAVDFTVLVTEAWMLGNLKDEQEIPQNSIADHPDRMEAVIFSIMSKDCQLLVVNPLRRRPTRLERGAIDFRLQVKGRMVRETTPAH